MCGMNLGLTHATGDYLALVSNDVVVTKGWLARMIAVAQSDPTIGLVGPIGPNVSGLQGFAGDYNTLPELDAWATHIAAHFAGQIVETPRLVGFCLVMTRACYTAIGGFDERFVNSHEDDDLCRRAIAAGYCCVVDFSTWTEHAGSITLRDLGPKSYQRLLDHGQQVYDAKWGKGER